jgi:hypothetical protein
MMLAVAALVLSAAIPAPASHEDVLRTDWLDYAVTNTQVPVDELTLGIFGKIHPEPISAPCDEAGIGGVRFCEGLQRTANDTMPNYVNIDVRDDLGPRVGFYYKFESASGSTLRQGYACGNVNYYVPHSDLGSENKTAPWFPDAVALVVTPDIWTSAQLCGSPTVVTGTVTVTWRYDSGSVFKPDVEEEEE